MRGMRQCKIELETLNLLCLYKEKECQVSTEPHHYEMRMIHLHKKELQS